jgi:HSP20 family molecular chaperone IbpA
MLERKEKPMPKVEVQKVPAADDRSLPIFSELEQLADRIRLEAYNLFARRGSGDGHALDDWLAAEREICWPSAELSERNGNYTLKVALAGFEPDDIAVTATPREIIVKAARKHEEKSTDEGDTNLRWSETRSNEVFRRVALPAPVDVEKTSARFKNGQLEIVAPKLHLESELESESHIKVTGSS